MAHDAGHPVEHTMFWIVWHLALNPHALRKARKDGVEFHMKKVLEFDRDSLSDAFPIQTTEFSLSPNSLATAVVW